MSRYAPTPEVMAIGQINISGNVTPANWWKYIRLPSGRPDATAIALLSEIVYWYRPTEVRDEHTGALLGYRKRFQGDKLQRSYQAFAEITTETKNTIDASADASAPARSARQEYSPEFEQAWQEYPKRAGGNSKSAAFKAWKARIREGIKPETMLDGVKRYAAWVRATGNTGTQFVKQAATFFGPDRHFEDYWQQPAAHGGGRQRQVDVLAGLGAMSDKFGKSSNKLTF